MAKQKRVARQAITVVSLTLFVSLACQTAQRALANPTPTAEAIVASATPTVFFTPTQTLPPFTATATIYPAFKPIACEDDSCLDECLKRIEDTVEIGSFDPLRGHYDPDTDFTLVVYDVVDGKIGEPNFVDVSSKYKEYQEDLAAQQRIWNYASGLLPPNYMKWVHQFYIYTDGTENSLAWVEAEGEDWILAVDILDSENPVDLTESLLHEYGHLITLNAEQVKTLDNPFSSGWKQDGEACSQLLMPDGCAEADSYIQSFFLKFWTDIFNEWYFAVETKQARSMEEYQQNVMDFYEKHADEFVREYAATNIAEDMAESFMNFILHPKPQETDIVSQKILFYYDFPELVALRKQTIQNMCSYAQE